MDTMNTGYTLQSRSSHIQVPPHLEPHHILPEDTITGYFTSTAGRRICFADYIPGKDIVGAVVISLATNEFAEKYAPLIHENAEKGLATFTLERYGNGLSARQYPHAPQNMSAQPMDQHVTDLDMFIDVARHQMKVRGISDVPLTLLGVSQGALVAAHLLHRQPDRVDNAILGVPMLGQHDLSRKARTFGANFYLDRYYPEAAAVIPTDFQRMVEDYHQNPHFEHHFSIEYQKLNPHLGAHCVTRGWIEETQKACETAKTQAFAASITTPSLVIVAQEPTFIATGKGREDKCVENHVARSFARHAPNAAYVPITGPHDLLTEAPPDKRAETIAACDAFVRDPAGFIASHPAPAEETASGVLKRFIQVPIHLIFGGAVAAQATVAPTEPAAPATPLQIESEYSGPAPASA